MAVFAGNHIHDQAALGIEDDQRVAGQWAAPQHPRFFDAVFGGCQMTAVHNAHFVAGQQRHLIGLQGSNDLSHPLARAPHQLARHQRFHASRLFIERCQRHRQFLTACLIGRVQRALGFADHQAQQIDDRRKQQRTLMLPLGRLAKQRVQLGGRQNVGHQAAYHRGNRSLLGKSGDERAE